ncbi:late embryogenesis abundant protein At1g64065-like [Salvia splendens]|uniref:late embryogenesis abundant protein At1g64065-like n=1 Tax=Salvia splendens TaxID=180675 RepID=UPI001C25AC8F|nr:late embryogenesis abundant protein At1g64065-like [Salvia splendens]
MPEDNRELRRRRRKRCLMYLLLLAVFKIGIILLLTLTLMRIRTPKFRVSSAAFGAFTYSAAADPSFDITLYAELAVKNTNFGRYKFDSTTVYFSYDGADVGSALVPGWTARARSTRKIRVQVVIEIFHPKPKPIDDTRRRMKVELSSAGLADRVQVKRDLEAGVLPLNSRAAVNGEVEVLRVFKRKKTAEMDCFLAINLVERSTGYLSCQ